jgi:DNA damage-binding protein 1
MISATMAIHKPSSATPTGDRMDTPESTTEYKAVVVVGTAYALHNEDEPTKGRIMVLACDDESDPNNRKIKTVAELQVRGGVYSMCQFYNGRILITVNSKTQMCQLVDDCTGALKLSTVGVGHHGHILSLFVSSRASKTLVQPSTAGESINADLNEGKKKPAESRPQLAIVGDLMRSISLVQHYPEHNTLEEVARDFNANWTTAVSMLTNDVYLGGENWNNLFVLRRNTKATSEEVRCRLDTVGEFHLGEMVNKFMSGSLVMPTNSHELSSKSAGNRNRRRSLTSPIKGDGGKRAASSPKGSTGNPNRSRRPVLTIGSQTLFGTTEGTLGAILGLDGPTTAFFACLERALQKVVKPIGNFSHQRFRAFNAEQRQHPSHGFVDGDLVESFLDLDKASMERVVKEMNRDGDWESDDSAYATGGTETDAMEVGSRPELLLDDVLALVEEMSMLH